jgi:hypothetical protein
MSCLKLLYSSVIANDLEAGCGWLRQAFREYTDRETTNGWDMDAEKLRETTRQDSVPLCLKLLI